MKTHLLLMAALCGGALPLGAQSIQVGRNVQVSTAHAGATHYEVLAAGDPTNADRMIIGSFIYPPGTATAASIVYTTGDGGKTWTPTLQGELLNNTSDPAPAYGPDGTAYYTASSLGPAGTPREDRRMLIFRSADGGSNWEQLTPFTYTDRQYVVVDGTGGKYHGRIYVNGANRLPPGSPSDYVVFVSEDKGETFSGPHTRADFGKYTAGLMGNSVVASDGTLIGVFEQDDALRVMTSTDGGKTLSPALVVDSQFVQAGHRKSSYNNVMTLPIMAIDGSKGRYRDHLYVVWADRRTGQSRIFFTSSPDRGKTWTKSRPIDDRPPNDTTDHFMPVVAVNNAGVVGVLWYDRRTHADNLGWDARFTASLDGGKTFLPSVKVSEQGTSFGPQAQWSALRPAVSRVPPRAGGGINLDVTLNSFVYLGGDTNGMVADANGVFHPVWVDNRTGVPQVWTAAVTVRPAAPLPGTDVSERVMLDVIDTSYDRQTETLTALVRLRNTSAQSLRGPLRAHIRTATSQLGTVELPAKSTPFVFDVASLSPGASTGPLAWRFKIADVQPVRIGNRYQMNLLDLHVQITADR